MPELLHISDIHFGPAFLPDRAAAIQHVIAHRRPDLVVVSGDLTRRAKRHQFEAAAEFLASFEEPVAVTPGNHDVPLYRVWERILSPYGLYREYVRQDLDSVYRIDGLTLVSLNSTGPLRITNGRLRGAQFEFAERAFDASPESDFRAIVTHHHLASPPDFAHGHVIPGARRALTRFTDMGVELILAGHLHRAYIGDSLDFLPSEGRESGIVIVQCGTTTSSRGRGRERLKNSLNYIRASRKEIHVTHYLWRDTGGCFQPHSEHRFGTASSAWLAPSAGAGTVSSREREEDT